MTVGRGAVGTGRLRWTTKLIYGVGDVGNAVVNSAVQFFLMLFYTDGALIWYPVTRASHAQVRRDLARKAAAAGVSPEAG